jgi:hypothetical protein
VSSPEPQEPRKAFHVRLPVPAYRKLRRLAGLPQASTRSKRAAQLSTSRRQAVLVRLPEPTYLRLRAIAISRSRPLGRLVSMRDALIEIIHHSRRRPNGRSDMTTVVTELIAQCPLDANG